MWPWVAGLIVALSAMPAMTQSATSLSGPSTIDVQALFASTCSFCHGDGGRAAGKGPQLMNTTRTDEFLRDRIKNGKEGAMPAFGQTLSDADVDAIIKYIRELKPEGQG
jgi:mono/diheme cytochrome c family protein